MVGGAVVTSRWAKRIGADLYGETAVDTVALLKNLFSV
jgi:methanogenic corrinoid protein MtbC1